MLILVALYGVLFSVHYPSSESKIETDMSKRDSDKKPEANTHRHTHTISHVTLCSISSVCSYLSCHSYVGFFLFSFFLLPYRCRFSSADCLRGRVSAWVQVSEGPGVGVMDGSGASNRGDPPYQNLLLLGAIAAASAFVVTILIVLVCVGCQR